MTPAENQAALLCPMLRDTESVFAAFRDVLETTKDDPALAAIILKAHEVGQGLVACLSAHMAILGQRYAAAELHNEIEQSKPLSDAARQALATMQTGQPQ